MKQGKRLQTGKTIGLAVAVVVLLSAVFCCLMGLLVCKDVIRVENAKIPALLFMMGALFAACCCTSRSFPKGKLQASFAVTAGVTAVMLAGKLIIYPERQFWNWWQLLSLAVISGLAGLISSRKKERRR